MRPRRQWRRRFGANFGIARRLGGFVWVRIDVSRGEASPERARQPRRRVGGAWEAEVVSSRPRVRRFWVVLGYTFLTRTYGYAKFPRSVRKVSTKFIEILQKSSGKCEDVHIWQNYFQVGFLSVKLRYLPLRSQNFLRARATRDACALRASATHSLRPPNSSPTIHAWRQGCLTPPNLGLL